MLQVIILFTASYLRDIQFTRPKRGTFASASSRATRRGSIVWKKREKEEKKGRDRKRERPTSRERGCEQRARVPANDDELRNAISPCHLARIGSGSLLFISHKKSPRARAKRLAPLASSSWLRLSLMLTLRCVYVVTQEMLLSCKANYVEPSSMKRAVMHESLPPRYTRRDDRVALLPLLAR